MAPFWQLEHPRSAVRFLPKRDFPILRFSRISGAVDHPKRRHSQHRRPGILGKSCRRTGPASVARKLGAIPSAERRPGWGRSHSPITVSTGS